MVFEAKVQKGDAVVAENLFYFKDVKNLQLEKPEIAKSIKKLDNGSFEITLTTDKLAKNVRLSTSAEGRFSNNFFDMLPGKSYTITFSGNETDLNADLKMNTIFNSY